MVGTENNHTSAAGHVIKHRPDGSLNRRIAHKAPGQILGIGAHRRVNRVQAGDDLVTCHASDTIPICNNSNHEEGRDVVVKVTRV